jgi:sigma-54 dependent transcriptional regulator, flagellar regulatory protein
LIKLPDSGINIFNFMHEIEVNLITQALTLCHGNRAHAAKLLGIGRSTLVAKMSKLCLMQQDFGQVAKRQRDKSKQVP